MIVERRLTAEKSNRLCAMGWQWINRDSGTPLIPQEYESPQDALPDIGNSPTDLSAGTSFHPIADPIATIKAKNCFNQ